MKIRLAKPKKIPFLGRMKSGLGWIHCRKQLQYVVWLDYANYATFYFSVQG